MKDCGRKAGRIFLTILRLPPLRLKFLHRLAQRVNGLLPEEKPRFSSDDRLPRTTHTVGDDGCTSCLRLKRDNAEIFHSRKEEGASLGISAAQILIADASKEFNVGAPLRQGPQVLNLLQIGRAHV